MDGLQALVLGLVEGMTEYLPVSSTGHLILAQRLMGIGASEAADAFAICIQAGAIAAVLGLYFGRVRQMVRGLFGRDGEGLRLAVNIGAAFVPAAVIGLLFESRIKHYLFNLPAILTAWLAGGVAILILARRARGQSPGEARGSLEELTVGSAVVIGFAQCVAMWPGVSRSLATIAGGLLVGLTIQSAVEFSFLLGVVTLSAATCHDLLKHGHALLREYDLPTMALGFIAAAVAAALSVRFMVTYLRQHSLAIFGWYRVAIAAVAGALLIGF